MSKPVISEQSIIIYDIETPKGYFLLCAYSPHDKTWWDFSITSGVNELYKLVKFLEENEEKWWVGFNNLSFDAQVVEWIYRNYKQWWDKSSEEIAYMIWEKAQEVIENSNYGLFPPYRENELSFNQVDLFRIQHFDNKNRRVGLKRLEYEMDAENIEEMGVNHTKEQFNEEERATLIKYCYNDVENTYLNYLHVVGDTDHALYKGNNQIETREVLSEEFGINCINYSNSKYGDEIIKTIYCRELGITYESLPKRGTYYKTLKFSKGIPSYIKFQTPELQLFCSKLKKGEIAVDEKMEESVHFRGQVYTFALGGLHNVIENKMYYSDEQYVLMDVDVTSYYPATIINNEYAPAHLKKRAFIRAYEWMYHERIKIKPLGKTDKRMKGKANGYKEALNAAYGKMGDISNWLFDPQARLNVCIAGEMSILMLIESMELNDFKCIMANTDGATFIMKRSREKEFFALCDEWKSITKYELEYKTFSKMLFLTVNDYLAEYETYSDPVMGKIKEKGDFLRYTELHKNKSFRIIPLAIEAYFIHNTPVERFVNEFSDIKQFCARSNVGDAYYHVKIDDEGNQSPLPKLVRYYVCHPSDGVRIMKMVKKDNETGAKNTNVSPADKKKVICNSLPPDSFAHHLQRVDRQWYIDEVNKIIYRLERGKKMKEVKTDKNQLSLF